MTKKLQEISLAFFLAASGVAVLMSLLWLRPVLDSHRQLIDETRTNQQSIMQGAEQTRTILTEIGYAAAVIALSQEGVVRPSEANQMLDESLTTIEGQSERLGKLARLVNEARIDAMGAR